MLRLQWNGLRPGDHVAVHDDTDSSFALSEGVVALVQTARRANEIAVRLEVSGTQPAAVRPRRTAVHLLPIDPGEPCWRCGNLGRRNGGGHKEEL